MAKITAGRGEYAMAKTYIERYRELVPHTADTLLLGLRIEQGLGDTDGVARYRTVLEQRFPDAPETQIAKETDFETFFDTAPKMNPDRSLIKGVVCGVRVEDVEEPLMRP